MLSRTADNLYWIARYMERAETLARLYTPRPLTPEQETELTRVWTEIKTGG
jgi:uncharacterized alpha-E superfamily protein